MKTIRNISLILYCMSMAIPAQQTTILNLQTQSALQLFGAMEQIIQLQESVNLETIDQATIDSNRLKSDFTNLLTSYLCQFGACRMSNLFRFYISSIEDKNKPLTPELYEGLIALLKKAEHTSDWAETIKIQLEFPNSYNIDISKVCRLHDIIKAIEQIPLQPSYRSTILTTAAAVAAITAGALAIYSIYQNTPDNRSIVPTNSHGNADKETAQLIPTSNDLPPLMPTDTSNQAVVNGKITTNNNPPTELEIEKSFFDKSWQEKTDLEKAGTALGGVLMAAPLLHPAVRQAGKKIATEGTTKLFEKLAGNIGDVADNAMIHSMNNQAKSLNSPQPPTLPTANPGKAIMIRPSNDLAVGHHGNSSSAQRKTLQNLTPEQLTNVIRGQSPEVVAFNNELTRRAALAQQPPTTRTDGAYEGLIGRRTQGNRPQWTS